MSTKSCRTTSENETIRFDSKHESGFQSWCTTDYRRCHTWASHAKYWMAVISLDLRLINLSVSWRH